ncbi:hypothetical protein HC248_00695 [Polaromonas vacuolata]|uniref:DUF1501 domain-containing protein n=1 Tax=Polaromonas vacuolata TaxID=37448 RepID=A0A6H2H7E2_9BURK|nr:DUF1501 domain-containing protein [Polaromonas vacuolata]QJC55416.1 hypothetical protein HC248_00695 [Polaromonas vacuolata]
MPSNILKPHPKAIDRRQALQTLLGVATACSAWAAPMAWAQSARPGQSEGRLVVVFLRGAYDGLSALVPHGDANYYALRPSIALAKPDGTAQTTLRLDNTFGLHPALAPLMPLWRQGVLTALPATGSPDPTRSHFDAQHQWEIGTPGKSGNAAGWMNTLAGSLAGTSADVRAISAQSIEGAENKPQAVGVGEANPQILAGSAAVQLVAKGQAATRQGAVGDERTRDAVMRLYSGQDEISKAFRAGADSRRQTAKTLSNAMSESTTSGMGSNDMNKDISREMQLANNGAGNAQGLLLDAQHLNTLMRQDRRLRLGFLSAGGWDTHANQGNALGALANNLGNLANTLVQLRREFSQTNDVVVVASEFGRTSAENGTRGTDHGHGNTMWIMGNRVNGGRVHGGWTGLGIGNLHENRDLPIHNDFRSVFAQLLRSTQGLSNANIDKLFPGFAWDKSLDSMLRT